jgi:hypothetical protein
LAVAVSGRGKALAADGRGLRLRFGRIMGCRELGLKPPRLAELEDAGPSAFGLKLDGTLIRDVGLRSFVLRFPYGNAVCPGAAVSRARLDAVFREVVRLAAKELRVGAFRA